MIKRVWLGEVALWKSFWLLGVGGFVFLALPLAGALLALTNVPDDQTATAFLTAIGLLLMYQAWVSVGIWRSASSYGGDPTWALAAKLCVAASALGVILMALSVIFADVT